MLVLFGGKSAREHPRDSMARAFEEPGREDGKAPASVAFVWKVRFCLDEHKVFVGMLRSIISVSFPLLVRHRDALTLASYDVRGRAA